MWAHTATEKGSHWRDSAARISFSAPTPTHAQFEWKIHLNFSYKRHRSRAILVQNSLWKATHGCYLSLRCKFTKVSNYFQSLLHRKWILTPGLFPAGRNSRNFCVILKRKCSDFSFNGYVRCESCVVWKSLRVKRRQFELAKRRWLFNIVNWSTN